MTEVMAAALIEGKDRSDGHWDDETSNNRLDRDGNLLPGSASASSSTSTSPIPTNPSPGQQVLDWMGNHPGLVVGGAIVVGGTVIVSHGGRCSSRVCICLIAGERISSG
jgi:hypothetical protein